MVSTKKDLQTRIEDAENGLDIETAEAKDLLNDETTRSHYIQAKLAARSHWKAGKLKLLAGNPEWETNVGEAAEFRLCHLQGTVAFYKAGEGNAFDTDWYKFSSHAETTLWLSAITGDPTQQRRITEIVEEYIEEIDSLTLNRLEAIRSTIQGDPEAARDHIERLEAEADTGTYRKGYLDRNPLTFPLTAVLTAILDGDARRFESALETYITADLSEISDEKLPYEDPELVHLPIPVVGMVALASRRGLDTASIDLELPSWLTTPEVSLVPEELLVHEWPSLDHDPSELVSQLWAKIDAYAYPDDGPRDGQFDQDEPEIAFEVGGTLDSTNIETPVWPPTVPYGHQTGDGIDGYQEYPLSVGHHRLAPIDKQLHDGDREAPVFQYAGTEDFLRQALGPLTSVSETVYLVVTEESIAFLTDLDPASFGMCFSTRERHFHVDTPGVVAIDADHLWAAADNVITNASETGVTIWMDGNEALHAVEYVSGTIVNDPANDPIEAVKSTTAEGEFRYQSIDARVPSSLPETLPEPGELTTFMTGVDSRSGPWSWAAPPATQLVLGSTFWIDSWLREDDSERLRLRAGLVNEDGAPGDGVVAIDSEGTDPTYRTGPSFGPTEDYSMGTEDLAGLVWPLSEGGDPTEEVADEFAPDTGTILPDTIGLTADSTYDRGTLWKFFRGFYHGKPPRMYGSFGAGDRLRLEYEVDSNSYLVYEQSAIDS